MVGKNHDNMIQQIKEKTEKAHSIINEIIEIIDEHKLWNYQKYLRNTRNDWSSSARNWETKQDTHYFEAQYRTNSRDERFYVGFDFKEYFDKKLGKRRFYLTAFSISDPRDSTYYRLVQISLKNKTKDGKPLHPKYKIFKFNKVDIWLEPLKKWLHSIRETIRHQESRKYISSLERRISVFN